MREKEQKGGARKVRLKTNAPRTSREEEEEGSTNRRKKKNNKHPDQENKRLTFEKVTLFYTCFVIEKREQQEKKSLYCDLINTIITLLFTPCQERLLPSQSEKEKRNVWVIFFLSPFSSLGCQKHQQSKCAHNVVSRGIKAGWKER